MQRISLLLLIFIVVRASAQDQEIVTFRAPAFRSVRFVDTMHGWIAGTQGVFYSSDGGETWQRKNVNLQTNQTTQQVISYGLIAWVDQNQVIVRSEAGLEIGTAKLREWRRVTIPPEIRNYLIDMAFIDEKHGYGISSFGSLYETNDGGVTWGRSDRAFSNPLKDLFVLSYSELWCVGGGATVLHTTDKGKTWHTQILSDATSSLGGLADFHNILFISANEGWLTGTDGIIYHTGDGGRHWNKQKTPFTAYTVLKAISFIDDKRGWVVGSRYIKEPKESERGKYQGLILYTNDGGSHWEAQASDINDRLLSIQGLSNGHAWVVGENGTVLRTRDYGKNWTAVRLN